MKRRYLQLDVFAERAGQGNPLGVVLDADGLDGAEMQRLAAWLNLSETTFVLAVDASQADYRLRIFTPRQELPFAGHPSVGTAFALLCEGRVAARGDALLQECAAGLLPVQVAQVDGRYRVAVRAPRARRCVADEGALQPALQGMTRGALPAALIDNGPRWWCVELADESCVRGLQPDLDAIAAASRSTRAVGLAVFAHCTGSEHALVVRAFVPADGIPEDPVTGSANAAIAAWLHANDRLPSARYVASQGRELGRDGRVEVRVDDQGEVWIGGACQTVIVGEIDW